MFYTGAYRYNYFDMSKRGSRQDIKPESEWVIVEEHHPAIVPKERWRNVVLTLERNRRVWQDLQPEEHSCVRRTADLRMLRSQYERDQQL